MYRPMLFRLTRIPGLGPKKALVLYDALGIQSIGELEYAWENRLVELAGFGAKTRENILTGIEYKAVQGQFLLADVKPLAEKITAYIRKLDGVKTHPSGGKHTPLKETVKDIDIVVAGDHPNDIAQRISCMPGVDAVGGSGSV